jgi:hypothetical protein
MTRENDEVVISEKIGVTLDICSSTSIIEDLLKNQQNQSVERLGDFPEGVLNGGIRTPWGRSS